MEELQNTKQRGGMQGIVVTIMVIKNAASGMIQYTRLQEQSWTWLVITSQIDYGNGTGWNPIRSVIIAELAERSPIIIQNSSKASSRKKFGCTDRTTVQGATFNMRGQLYRGRANATALFQWSVHWAPSRTTRVLVLVGAKRCALETCGNKNASSAFRLG